MNTTFRGFAFSIFCGSIESGTGVIAAWADAPIRAKETMSFNRVCFMNYLAGPISAVIGYFSSCNRYAIKSRISVG